jgi:hypothetical protein
VSRQRTKRWLRSCLRLLLVSYSTLASSFLPRLGLNAAAACSSNHIRSPVTHRSPELPCTKDQDSDRAQIRVSVTTAATHALCVSAPTRR